MVDKNGYDDKAVIKNLLKDLFHFYSIIAYIKYREHDLKSLFFRPVQ